MNLEIVPNLETSITRAVPLTKSHFIDAYSKGLWNLSNVPCPEFLANSTGLEAPESYNETLRLKVVRKHMDLVQWNNKQEFHKLMLTLIKSCKVSGCSISLMDDKKQVIKHNISFGMSECPRKISLDSHAISSSHYLILSDTLNDWRFENNFLVNRHPHIRFYAGVPLVAESQIIGVLAMFDGFPRKELDVWNLRTLQDTAQKVMELLHKPVEVENLPLEEKNNVFNKIGRATGSQRKLTNLPVYERDGSGTPYLQNLKFRFGKDSNSADIKNSEIWKNSVKQESFKSAAQKLCEHLCERCGLDLVYVLEIRVIESYQIEAEYFPQKSTIEAHNFKYADKLERTKKENIMTRVIDSYPHGYKKELEQSQLHFRALSSEFGIFVRSKTNIPQYKSGTVMAFYRVPSKFVRLKKISSTTNQKGPVELYLKSGGYIIAGFYQQDRELEVSVVNELFDCANVYRKIYINELS